jgi:hypothetical protein
VPYIGDFLGLLKRACNKDSIQDQNFKFAITKLINHHHYPDMKYSKIISSCIESFAMRSFDFPLKVKFRQEFHPHLATFTFKT